MKRKMFLCTVFLSAVLALATSAAAYAGEWKTDSVGRWYQNDDGSYTTNNWQKIKDTDGVERWYLFDAQGYICTGFQEWNGHTYLLRTEEMATLKEVSPDAQVEQDYVNNWGNFNVNPYPGAMVTGHFKDFGRWYYFNDGIRSDLPEGAMILNDTLTFEDGRTATYDAEGLWVE